MSDDGLSKQERYEVQFAWQKQYYPQVVEIIKKLAPYMVNIRVATENEDMQRATDFVLTVDGGDIAVRIRNPYLSYRDLTIRKWTPSGARTEWHKIRDGFGRWYFYAWKNKSRQLAEWILVDLDKLRDSGILEWDWPRVPNKYEDDNHFIAIPPQELDVFECITARRISVTPARGKYNRIAEVKANIKKQREQMALPF